MINKLKRWLSGDADWKTEQELNRIAQDDAFLGDAMEGYRTLPEGDHSKNIKDLKANLQHRYKKERRGFAWRNVAAAAAVIGVIGLLFWTQNIFDENRDIAANQEPEMSIEEKDAFVEDEKRNNEQLENINSKMTVDGRAEDNDQIIIDKSEPIGGEQSKDNLAFNDPSSRSSGPTVDPSNIEAGIIEEADLADPGYISAVPITKYDKIDKTSEDPLDVITEDDTTKDNALSKDKAESADVVVLANEPATEVEDITRSKAKVLSKPANPTELANESKKSDAYSTGTSNIVKGTITDKESGDALISANVYIKNTGEGSVADLDGKFTLESRQSLPWTIVVNYIGYADQEIEVFTVDDILAFELEISDVALESVVVTSTGQSKKKRRKDARTQTPKPSKGFSKMKRYIRRNLNYPEIARQNNLVGEVLVRFYINDEGRPVQLTVQKSLGSGCDEEAIRLIQEGPKWTPKNTWAAYSVPFGL